MSLKRKYVDSHWLVFAFQGVIALLFGWFTLFANLAGVNSIVAVLGSVLLGLGIIELFNLLRRAHLRETWGLSLAMALLEIVAAFALLFTLDMNNVFHLVIVASYTVIRGLLEVALGIRSVDDRTDRFIWVLLGLCGCILGIVILNSGDFTESTTFIKIFGSYLTLAGVCNLIYGVHNRDQAKEYREQTSMARKSKKADGLAAMKSARINKTAVKSSPRSKAPAKKVASKSAARPVAKSSAKSSAKKPASKASTRKTTKRK